VDILNC